MAKQIPTECGLGNYHTTACKNSCEILVQESFIEYHFYH